MPAANVVVHLHGRFQTVSRRGGDVLRPLVQVQSDENPGSLRALNGIGTPRIRYGSSFLGEDLLDPGTLAG
jgi:hypothetical protein